MKLGPQQHSFHVLPPPPLSSDSHDVISYLAAVFPPRRRGCACAEAFGWGGRKKEKKTSPVQQQQQQQCVFSSRVLSRERASGAELNPTPPPSPPSTSTQPTPHATGTTREHSGCPEFPHFLLLLNMSVGSDFGNPLRKFKLVFLGEQSGKTCLNPPEKFTRCTCWPVAEET